MLAFTDHRAKAHAALHQMLRRLCMHVYMQLMASAIARCFVHVCFTFTCWTCKGSANDHVLSLARVPVLMCLITIAW